MEIILNDYHMKVNAEMRAKVAYWQEHPQSRKESLRRLKLLREQRLGRSRGQVIDLLRKKSKTSYLCITG